MSFPKFSITKEIRSILINDEIINEMVGNNIYPLIALENTKGDCILYYRDGYGKDYTSFGNYNDNCKVFIAIVSENYDRSISIAERIDEILEGEHLNINNNVYECYLADSTEDYEDKKYIQILLYKIK